MSTTINVTVDDGGLPAKNRQQTAANRQAYVQGRASQQAAQQGANQRAADRRAAGLDPTTGRPLAFAGASSRLPRIDQEPAANRRLAPSKLSIYYTDQSDSIFISGDGLQNAQHTPFTPTPSDYAELEPIAPLTILPESTSERMVAQWAESGIEYLDEFFFEFNSFVETKQQIKTRHIYSSAGGQRWVFPLSSSTAIEIRYNYYSEASVITDYFVHAYYLVEQRLDSYKETDTILSETFTAETENSGTLQEHWSAVLVGDTVASSVAVPEILKSKLRSLINQSSAYTYTQAPRGCRIKFPDGEALQCIGQSSTDYQETVAVNLTVAALRQTPKAGYGLVGGAGITPAAWVALESESVAAAMNDAVTHEQFTAIPQIAQLFSFSRIFLATVEDPRRWYGIPLTGDIEQYPASSGPGWLKGVKLQMPLAVIPPTFSPRFINDWNQAAYCAAQASTAGIA